MRKRIKTNIAVLCIAGLMLSVLCGAAPPEDMEHGRRYESEYTQVAIYVDGILTTSGYMVGSRAYMSVEDFCAAVKMEYEPRDIPEGYTYAFAVGSDTALVSGDGSWIEMNGRYFYLCSGPREIGGILYLPAAELGKLVCAPVQWDDATSSVDIDLTCMAAPLSGSEFYDAEDLKWLSMIINAESGNQPLEGMMAVGDVVMNRVRSESCPDTVYGVIFDTRYGVQFSPVETGGIYAEPNERSVVAAKLCLEGYNIVGDCMYFVNPVTGSTEWFRETRTFVMSIGDHDFYA